MDPMEAMLELAGLVLRQVVVDGFNVSIMGDAGTTIQGDGWSWSWLSDERGADGFYHAIAPTAAELKTWTPVQIEEWARKALAVMNEQHARNHIPADAKLQFADGTEISLADVFNNRPAPAVSKAEARRVAHARKTRKK